MIIRWLTIAVLFACATLCSACGGGGSSSSGGGSGSGGGGGGITPPTTSPTASTIGDVRYRETFGRTPAMTYDDDDGVLIVAQGTGFLTGTNGLVPFGLPANDPSPYITSVFYSRSQHAIYFSGSSTIYRATFTSAATAIGTSQAPISSITVGPDGTVYAIENDRVAKLSNGVSTLISPANTVTPTESTTYATPQIAFDTADGNLYVTDPLDSQIERVTTSGTVSSIAGTCIGKPVGVVGFCFGGLYAGTGSAALLAQPSGIAYDDLSNVLYVSDFQDNDVWTVTAAGTATNVAGWGPAGESAGNGLLSLILSPISVAFSHTDGSIFINELAGSNAGPVSDIWTYATTGAAAPQITLPVIQYPTPTHESEPQALALAPDNSAWLAETNVQKVGHVPTNGITEISLPGVRGPNHVVVDPDGNIWLTAATVGGSGIVTGQTVIRVTPSGAITDFPLQNPTAINASLTSIAIGPDGNPWFGYSENSSFFLDTIDRTSGTLTGYSVSGVIAALTTGPDGLLWYAFSDNGAPEAIAKVRADGTAVGTPIISTYSPGAMTSDAPDGSVWYVDGSIHLGRVSIAGNETDTATGCLTCYNLSLAAAADGTIWYTESNPDAVAHRNADGSIVRYLMPYPGGGLNSIAIRSDNSIWVGMNGGSVFLFNPAIYDSLHLWHPTTQSIARHPARIDRRAAFGGMRPARKPLVHR